MAWNPVKPEALAGLARAVRERRLRDAGARVAPPLATDVRVRLQRADEALAVLLQTDGWRELLDIGADIHGHEVVALVLPNIYIDYVTGDVGFAWTVRRSRQCAEVVVEVGPVVTLTQISISMFGPARRLLGAASGLLEAAKVLNHGDQVVGVPALVKVSDVILEGVLLDLLRERLWIDARRALA